MRRGTNSKLSQSHRAKKLYFWKSIKGIFPILDVAYETMEWHHSKVKKEWQLVFEQLKVGFLMCKFLLK